MPRDHSKDNDPNFKEFHEGYERDATPPQTHEHHNTAPENAKDLAHNWKKDMDHYEKHEHHMQELERHKQQELHHGGVVGLAKAAVDSVKEGIESIPTEFYAQKAANARPDIEDLQERQNQ